MNAFVIDAFEFCRTNERREGENAVSELPRLAQESIDRFGSIKWALAGGMDRSGHPQLTLSVSGSVRLICQRCLTPLVYEIASRSSLILAQDEANADEIDGSLDNDSIDVVVGSRAFNIAELIEDEALLAIPLSVKHDACPDHAITDVLEGGKKASPFAVLKNLK